MDAPKYSVSAILVTYGSRWNYVQQVLDRLLELAPTVERIFIVDNGSEDNLTLQIERMGNEMLRLVHLDENTGSANGFKVGIETALAESDSTFFWLLDDDNRPCPDALAKLIAAYRMLGDEPANTFVSMRRDRQEFLNAALYGSAVEIKKNSFMGFHVGGIPEKVKARMKNAPRTTPAAALRCPLLSIGFAPYGGFFFHRSWIEKIGVPRVDFFLYGDDHEFTSRVISYGGKIYLCATSEVEDLEVSWNKAKVRSHRLIAPQSSALYVYYSTRNRVYIEVSNYVTSKFIYHLNMMSMMFILLFLGLFVDKDPLASIARWKVLWRAIWAGKKGKLGRIKKEICMIQQQNK